MRRATVVAVATVLLAATSVAWMATDGFGSRGAAQTANKAAPNGDGPQKARGGKGGGAPVAVETAAARAAKTTTDIRSIGTLRSDESVLLSFEIAGRLSEVNFREGGLAKAGDELAKLDDSLVRAEFADAQARLKLAEANNARAKQLSRSGNVTEKAIDEAAANFEIAKAAVELQRVRIAKHTIGAPFPGRVGLRRVSPGSYVAIGTPIVNLEKIDFLKVDFKLPESFLAAVAVGQTVDVTVDALPDRVFQAEIYAIDPQVDVNGRALALRARLSNPKFELRPGLFARIVVKGQQARDVVLAPESAIVPRGGESYVFRVENGTAREAQVKLGERRGTEVEILEGVAPNTVLVTAGQLKLRDGTRVDEVSRDPTPIPADTAAAKKDGA